MLTTDNFSRDSFEARSISPEIAIELRTSNSGSMPAAPRFPAQKKSRRWTAVAWSNYWRSYNDVERLFRAAPFLESIAARSWEIAPGTTSISRGALFLPGQFERVTGTAYTGDPRREMAGGIVTAQPPTRGFEVRDAILLDGSLYKLGKRLDLHSRKHLPKIKRYIPRMRVEYEIECGAIYNTYDGNEFFGLWLTDDCPTYLIAQEYGVAVATNHYGVVVATNRNVATHIPQYEELLGMTTVRVNCAYLRKTILFDDDWGNNASKLQRFNLMREKLLGKVKLMPHPGVFIMRRDSGKARIMYNEVELAERLRERRGFRIIDVTRDSVSTIISTCAGAAVVIGVEGSNLAHGLMAMHAGGALVALQPPDRFCGVLKRTTDMAGINYGFVVGQAESGGFRVDPIEVERTLDLLPRASDIAFAENGGKISWHVKDHTIRYRSEECESVA